ncbi:unnamed protein product, partial [Prorocentrum cordatum]
MASGLQIVLLLGAAGVGAASAVDSGLQLRGADAEADVEAQSGNWDVLDFEPETTVPARRLSDDGTTAPGEVDGTFEDTTDGAGSGFACTPDDLLESTSCCVSTWRQYCSSLTTGAKSFAMSLDCQFAAFSNVSGSDTSESSAEAMDNCSEAGGSGSEPCAVFDEGGALCQLDSLTHIMHINVQMDATNFRFDARSVAAVSWATAALHA